LVVADIAWSFWPADKIAEAADVDEGAVKETWPHVAAQLQLCGIYRPEVAIGVIGTMAHETASTFKPVVEAYWLLGPNGEETDSWRSYTSRYEGFPGRGDVQLTWRSNYARYSEKLEKLWGQGSPNLVENPSAALDQDVAAAVIGLWFRDERALPTPSWPQGYSLQNACDLADDDWIRILVYGASDPVGQARIAKVRAALTGTTQTVLTYNPKQPPERQIQNWACSIRATTWELKSLGIDVDAGQMQDEMVPGTVTPALGCLDARGYGLAAIIGKHLPSGTKVEVIENVTWSDLVDRAGRGPIALGSSDPRLYHWFNIAEFLSDGTFSSPNPAPNYPIGGPLGDVLDRSEFDRYAGSFSAVFVETLPVTVPPNRPVEPVPAPVPTPAPQPTPPVDPDWRTLVASAYNEDGQLLPVLDRIVGAKKTNGKKMQKGDMQEEARGLAGFLRDNRPK
jgi:hypothetical protein